jgi:Zn-dependent metalloprotease
MSALVLLAAAGSAVAAFRADFPAASVIESPSGKQLTSSSGFEARGLGANPQEAATAFLARYGAAFGIAGRQRVAVADAAPPGGLGRVRFERRIDGLPVFDADVVVGVDAASSVILVNTSQVPAKISGRFRLSKKAAIRAAVKAVGGPAPTDSPRAARGWRATASAIRPAWRVDFVSVQPPGDFRTYVDAETGKVLLRKDLRSTAGRP